MKFIYHYDATSKQLIEDQTELVNGDFDVSKIANTTDTQPAQGLYYPVRFDEATKTWIGVSKEDYEAKHPSESVAPTTEQQQQAQILLTVAKNKADQDKINAQLLLALASNQIGGGQNG